MTISVIVPAYNAQKTIGHTLKAILNQDCQDDFEIIVVDDGSTDETANIIRSFTGILYVHQSNSGPAAARNNGARLARGVLLAFTDSDCIPHRDWLTRLKEGFNKANVSVVMGSYGIANHDNWLAYCIYKEILFRHNRLLPDYPKVFGSYNFCVKKEVFEKAGGFNGVYKNASGEDNDLSYEIIKAGGRIFFQRKALVDHFHPTQVKKYLKEQFRHGFWRVTMYVSHPGMIKGDDYTFWKDSLEVAWCGVCFLEIVLSLFNIGVFKYSLFPTFTLFIIFEIIFSYFILCDVRKVFLWGFIMFLRSFSRTLGLSTGIFLFFGKKILNKP